MAKEYIGSQEHFEDVVNAYYDQKEQMQKQYEKEMYEQMELDYWNDIEFNLKHKNK